MSGETGLIRVKQDGSRWAAVESWWRCTGMHRTEGMVFKCNHVMHREAGHPLIDCNQCYDKDREWEPVAVLPIAELEALRAREIDWEKYNALDSEVDRLRSLLHDFESASFADAVQDAARYRDRCEIAEAAIERLLVMEKRLESDIVLPEEHGNPTHRKYVKGCSYCEGWDDGIDVFRAAVLGGA